MYPRGRSFARDVAVVVVGGMLFYAASRAIEIALDLDTDLIVMVGGFALWVGALFVFTRNVGKEVRRGVTWAEGIENRLEGVERRLAAIELDSDASDERDDSP